MKQKLQTKLEPYVGMVVMRNYRLVRKLGTGAFGDIFLAVSTNKETEKLAAKLEAITAKHPQLQLEAKLYRLLNEEPCVGFPKMHGYASENGYNVMLLDLLGKSLQELLIELGRPFSLKTVVMLGQQLLDRVERLHEKQFLHRDIKPQNLLMGLGKNSHLLYMIDMGLAKKYMKDGKVLVDVGLHAPYKDQQCPRGTIKYVSISTHQGVEQSRRDDLETVGYVLVYLLKGMLPWQNVKFRDDKDKYRTIMERKMAITAEELCIGFPGEFAQFINYSRRLKYEEQPDYAYLRKLLDTIREREGFEIDYIYDWTPLPAIKVTQVGRKELDDCNMVKVCSRKEQGISMDIERSCDSKKRLDINFGNTRKQQHNKQTRISIEKNGESSSCPIQRSPAKLEIEQRGKS